LWQKKFDHTTKYTKSTKVIYFILLFLRDLRGKNKTDLFFTSGLSWLGYSGQIFHVKLVINLKSAIAYLATASRRRVCCRSKLLQTPCNTEDAVKGAIPKGTNFKNFFFKGAIPKGTNFKNFFYFYTQQYDAPQNIYSIC